MYAGCYRASGNAYTHDAQCITYPADGPTPSYAGKEICFCSNAGFVAVADVTNKNSPVELAKVSYSSVSYTHQSWVSGGACPLPSPAAALLGCPCSLLDVRQHLTHACCRHRCCR